MDFFDTKLFGIELSPKKRNKLLIERQQLLDNRISQNTKIQEETKDAQKGTLEILYQNRELQERLTQLQERLTKLVAENKEKENILLAREKDIKSSENDIEERKSKVRKEEVYLEARKSDIRRLEQEVSKNEKDVKEREAEAQKLKSESEQAKEKYQILEGQKENIINLEKEAKRKNEIATEKESLANSIFEKAKVIDEEIKSKEAEFETKRMEIENSLNEKIAEYDRRLADMESVREFIEDVKFDESQEGKQAKIVVKEAIRIAKKQLGDIKIQFDELDEKYCNGTFKGFSTPISEIDNTFKDLKTQYEQVKEHLKSNSLPECVNRWLETIEKYINDADKSVKSWEFSEAYRNIIFGLSTCKNYELLLNILNEWGNGGTSSEEESGQEEEFTDHYEIFGLNPDATKEEIKKRYRELMKKYHPDKNLDNPEYNEQEYKEMTQKIKEAKDILCDDEKRKKFDEKRKNHKK